MGTYMLLKHYRGAPAPDNNIPMGEWTREEIDAHVQYMNDFADRLSQNGEFVEGLALSPEGQWVSSGDDGVARTQPLADTKDLIAGWMIITVESHDRAMELAAELSRAPGAGGRPINEWLEVRELLEQPT